MESQQERHIVEDGWVKRVRLTPPGLSDNTSDAERLVEGLKGA
jgi:hypothetical protein